MPHGKESCHCRKHVFNPWSRKNPRASEELRLWTKTIEPVLHRLGATAPEPMLCHHWSLGALGPTLHSKRSRCNEKARHHNQSAPTHRNRSTPAQQQGSSTAPTQEKSLWKNSWSPCSALTTRPVSGLSSGRCRPAFRGNCGVGSELACPPVE